jgi:hypothetical protein
MWCKEWAGMMIVKQGKTGVLAIGSTGLKESEKRQSPPDVVVKLKPLLLPRLCYNYADDSTLFKHQGDTGYHGVSCLHHLRRIGPPRNPMECDKIYRIFPSKRWA